ncbi:hypothetical protein HYH02_013554 [Chlamydomonas schloesseri]|uniref:Uncharacterized protein n=1 Tax=Chlamydomonas schloesseri TaxID=2026947 RepID=A0A835SSP3_9CHLO|nr:hypothetical protein HYH02_013554 [Chlamydomonas schloesseri]|eukprot:KAG2430712.1 hypothetical protein HYH02_013554 [Chlamydomonas schloesseri]
MAAVNDEPEFTKFQRELDAAFHASGDPFPSGTPEHAELLGFVAKLAKFRRSRPEPPAGASGTVAPDPDLAARLGLPTAYDPRFRLPASLVAPQERVGAAVRAIARRMAQQQQRAATTFGSGRDHGRDRDRDRGWDRDRRGGGGGISSSIGGGGGGSASVDGGMTPEIVEAAKQVVEEYRRLLPWFEDFHQRRQMARLRKLQADRAALPAAAFRGAIVSALASSQALVVAGDTGCGKSTQIPQYLAAAGYRRIAVTQPRRISAVSLARRVAVEAGDAHGSSVGFKVRFSSSVAGSTRIVFCTEGILLRELAGDPLLSGYDVVVLDEVHERHLTTDFLLALLRALLLQRPELRLVLMSATINCAAFADYFGGAPIVQIPGRLYPIQLVYVPPEGAAADEARRRAGGGAGGSSKGGGVGGSSRSGGAGGSGRGGGRGGSGGQGSDQIDPAPYLRLLQRIDTEVPSSQRGDLLVFVAGTADIAALCAAMAPYAEQTRRWVILPLHAALPLEAQEKVFDVPPDGVRKAIISTNIAETSLTIDGVRFVCDSGRAKEMIHDVASGGGSLQEGWISRASADQRKGRAGRTGPGVCYRVYTEAQYDDMRPFSAPEIARVRLEAVVLGIKALAGGGMDPRAFGFIDPPPPDRLEAAITTLKQIGALTPDAREGLTPLGAVLSLLPVDPAVGKLLVLAAVFGLAGPALTLAAALSVQSPFLKLGEEEQDQEAKAARASLVSPHGDPLTLLNVFETWLAIKEGGGGGGGGGYHGGDRDRRDRGGGWDRGDRSGDRRGGVGGGGGGGGGSVSSSRWCRRHGLAEARLYEMAKLRAQFAELLADAGILRVGGGTALSAAEVSARRRRHLQHQRGCKSGGAAGLRGAELHAAKRRLRDMQAERERKRGRKVLKVDKSGGRGGDDGSGGGSSDGVDGSGSSSGEEQLEALHDLDLRVHVDVKSMAAEAARPLTPADVGLLRHLLAVCLYPRIAVGDEANPQRRDADCRFYTATGASDLVLHPGSVLAGAANEVPRGQVLAYTELIETRRQYLSGLTPLWALPALLLAARRLDCDAGCGRWLVDGWLLLRVHDGAGPKVLQQVLGLRGGSDVLVSSRLRAARLAALTAVHTVDDGDVDETSGGDGGGASSTGKQTAENAVAPGGRLPMPPSSEGAATGAFQKGYAAVASALPEELRPLLSGVMAEQAAWRETEATRRRHAQERERRRLQARDAAGAGGASGSGSAQAARDWRQVEEEAAEDEAAERAEALRDAMMEDEMARRLALDMWPCRYSLERLPPGNKVTAQFIIEQQQQPPVSMPMPPQPGGYGGGDAAAMAPTDGAAAGGGPSGAAVMGVSTDVLGVPYHTAGMWLTPWLRYGSLRGYDSAMALHALQPALRKPWACPGCGLRLVGTFGERRGQHLQQLQQQVQPAERHPVVVAASAQELAGEQGASLA